MTELERLRERWREGGRKRWAGVPKEERTRVLKRARKGQRFKARKSLQGSGKEETS